MSGWETVALGDVARIDRQGVPPKDLPGDALYLGLEHIARGGEIIGSSTVEAAELASTKFRFDENHVLFGKLRPNLGKVAKPEQAGVCSTDILPISPSARLDRSFLVHYLRQPSMVSFASSRASGANLPRLSPKALGSFTVPLPPVDVQRRIASILDEADAIRAKRRAQLAHLDELPPMLFHETFEGEDLDSERLGELAQVSSGITKGRRTSEQTHLVPYLAVANVQAGKLALDSVKSIDATETEIDRYRLQPGDVVLTEGGDPDKLGRGALWRGELEVCLHQNHVFRVRFPKDGAVLPEYFAAVLLQPKARRYFLRSAKQTTGIASINITQLRALPVPVPTIDEQEAFLSNLVAVRSERDRVARALEADDELFAALQHRAFRGEL